MAAPSVVGTWVAEASSNGQYITVNRPPNVGANTTLLVFVSSAYDADPIVDYAAPNSEWTKIALTPDWRSTSIAPVAVVWIRTPQAALPPATMQFRHDYTEITSATCLAIDSVDSVTPKNTGAGIGTGWSKDTDNTDTQVAPSITTTANDCLLINLFATTPNSPGTNDYSAAPAGNTGFVQTTSSNYQAQLVSWETRATSGSTGTRTATFGDTSGAAGPPATYTSIALNGIPGTGSAQTISVGLFVEEEDAWPVTIFQAGQPPAPARTYPISRAERVALLEASSVSFSLSRIEVLNEHDDIERENIAQNVHGCRIEHGGFRNIHRLIDIEMDTELDWGRQRIKPYLTISGGGWTDTLPLGVFLLTAPTMVAGVRPMHFDVQGYDKMYLVDQPLALPVSYPIGQPILAAVRDLLSLRGMQIDHIDNNRATDTLVEVRAWALEQGHTYLGVINDLLAMVGYRALRIDRDGFPESGPHAAAPQREVMWRYDADSPTTTVHLTGREHVDDFTNRPNRWVFWQNGTERTSPPQEGDGLYIVDNIITGLSSQSARGGLVITRAEGIEALTQADLVANGDRIIAEDMESSATLRMTTDLNPYHDHQDIIEVIDRDLGVAGPFESMVWNMDIFTRLMTHEMRMISGGVV